MDQFVSYAQNGEDVVLWRALGHVRDGRYVDVGACEPEHLSITKAFCDRGWRGVDIEPVQHYADLLRAARPNNEIVQAAITDEPVTEIVLHEVEGTGLSTLDDKTARGHTSFDQRDVVVPARTLDDVCSASGLLEGELHFLKVDVEGAETAVLRSVSLDKWRPWVVVVEATRPLSGVLSHDEWEPELTQAGYEFTLFDGLNRFYISPHHPELREPLSYPACVLDGFITAGAKKTAEEFGAVRAEIVHWRNLAVGGFVESTSLAQAEHQEARALRRQVERLTTNLEKTKDNLLLARTRNQNLTKKLAYVESRLEVRARRKVGRLLRGMRGRS
ncbi:MAG: FkbM family methyltransferase [Aeromicrobium sp.]